VHLRADKREQTRADEYGEQTLVRDRDETLYQIFRQGAYRDAGGNSLPGERPSPRARDRHVVAAALEPCRQTDDVTLGAADVERVAHEEDSQPKIGPSARTDGSSPYRRACGRGPDRTHTPSNAWPEAGLGR